MYSNILDTPRSILLKKGKEFDIPIKFIYLGENLIDYIKYNKLKIYDVLQLKLNLSKDDIVYCYYKSIGEKMDNEINKYESDDKNIEIIKKRINEEYMIEKEELEKINLFQNILTSNKYIVELENFNIFSIKKKIKVEKIIDNEEIDIFNVINPTINIPIIYFCNENNNIFTKVYNNTKINYIQLYLLNLKNINFKELEHGDFIFIVSIFDFDISTISNNMVKHNIVCKYNIYSEILSFDTETESLILVIKKKLIELEIFKYTDNEISNFSAYINFDNNDLNFDKLIVNYLIKNDELVNNYLYIDESNKAICEILPFKIYLKEFFLIKLENFKYVISNCLNIEEITKGLKILSSILSYVITKIKDVKKIFSEYMIILENVKENKKNENFKKYKYLQEFDNLFLKGKNKYSRFCSAKNQPEIYNYFTHGETDLQILEYPYIFEGGNILELELICTDKINKYPYLKKNTFPENKDLYPYIPCCCKTDNRKNNFLKINLIKKQQDSQYFYNKTNLKISEYGEYNELNETLNNFLKKGLKIDNVDYFFKRVSVYYNSSSIIHCILFALRDNEYLNFKTMEERCEYVMIKRLDIAKKISPLVYKQELFDLTETEIVSNIENMNLFLDPYLYYRGLEEYFDINLYVINPKGKINIIKNIDDEKSVENFIETPRSSNIFIKYNNTSRKTILILKHFGSESNNLVDFPICELIFTSVNINKTKNNKKYGKSNVSNYEFFTFDEYFTNFIYNVICKTINNYIFSYSGKIECRNNPFNYINWISQFSDCEIVGQRINKEGHLIILGVKINKILFTLYVPPSQPLNVKYLNNLVSSSENDIISIFGEPSSKTSQGFFYKILDFENGIFIPLNNNNQLVFQNINKIKSIKKYTFILIDLIIWLFNCENIPFTQWWDLYVSDQNEIITPSIPTKIKKFLPNSSSTLEGLSVINSWWPEYFTQTKIVLYKKLYDSIFSYLNHKIKYLKMEKITVIQNYYSNFEDFELKSGISLFLDMAELNNFLAEKINNNFYNSNYKTIFSILKNNYFNIIEPIIFRDEKTQNIYIIQNVLHSHIENVINVCLNWKFLKINTSYYSPKNLTDLSSINHIIYSINNSGLLEIFENNSNGSNDYIQILKYSVYKYASILPIFIGGN
jgi:hypothetical protein